ncbi:MAG: ferric reductase [Pseudomonadota bacterium]
MRRFAIWAGLGALALVPVVLAAWSPYLAFRQPVYIIAGFAGIAALALMLFQPLLAAGLIPGIKPARSRRLHLRLGLALVLLVIIHVGGLWITSPPDVVDALLLVSPTPFSAWGVVAMWALFGAAFLALLRQRVSPWVWRLSHSALVVIAVGATLPHAWQIEGTMEVASKALLMAAVVIALFWALFRRRVWVMWRSRPQ